MNNVYRGLTTVVPTMSVFMSDYDGADMIEDFKKLVVDLRTDESEHYKPVHVYVNTGVIGDMKTERYTIYVYNGIPFILSTNERIAGSDAYDAVFDDLGGTFIASVAMKDCSTAYSLGFVPKNVNVGKFATKYIQKNPLIEDTDVSSKLFGIAISNGTVKSSGNMFVPGKYSYDVFSVDSTISKSIRTYKDFSENPIDETKVPTNMKEVVLYGGYPEIIRIGMLVTDLGYVYDVWIPNDYEYYERAKMYLDERWIPTDIFETESDDMVESYSLFYKYLNDLEESIAKAEDDESDYDDAPPSMELPELP